MIGSRGAGWKLLLALILPSALVAFGMFGVRDVRIAFILYVVVGCGLGPWVLLGARPIAAGRGLPWAAASTGGSSRSRFVAWFVFGPLFFAAYALLRRHIGDAEHYLAQLRSLGWRDEHELLYAFLFVLLIPVAEEWWWRGQALPRCVDRFGRAGGVALSAASFAAYHVFTLAALYDARSTSIRIAGIFVAGIVWSLLALRRGEWAVTYFAHLGTAMAIVAAFFIYVT